jgi:ferredoxin-NADP reductase
MLSTQAHFTATVAQLSDLTPTVREFTLQLPEGAPAWQPGAHVQVQVSTDAKAESQTFTRHYSLLPCPKSAHLRIAVKRAEPGRGGSQAMWGLSVGHTLRISAPLNHFTLDLNAPAYLLVAGGIGITPLVSMAQTLCKRGARVQMVYAARSREEWAYGEELQALLGERLQLIEGAGLDVDAAVAQLPSDGQAYVCGPSGMLSAMQQAWARTKRPPALLRFESFGGSSGSGDAQSAFEVSLPRHDLRFEVQPGASLLEAMEQQGLQAMYGCRRGECGLCALSVLALEGEIEHRDVFFSEHEKKSNEQICVCVSRVHGRITLDSAYRPDAIAVITTSGTR